METVKATLEGVLRNPDGDTVLFHWNLEEESTWSQTRKLDTTLSTATYDKAGDKLYVLDAAGGAPCGGHVLGFFLLSPQPHGGRF